MKNGSKRKAWTAVQVRELKTMARKKTPRWPNCQEVETDRGSNATKSVQHGIIARLALTRRSPVDFFTTKPRLARGFLYVVL
jgi:hypothetical protein